MSQKPKELKPWWADQYREVIIKQPDLSEPCRTCGHEEWIHKIRIGSLRECTYGHDMCYPTSAISIFVPTKEVRPHDCYCMNFIPKDNLKYLQMKHNQKKCQ